jgi:hypothetical protein
LALDKLILTADPLCLSQYRLVVFLYEFHEPDILLLKVPLNNFGLYGQNIIDGLLGKRILSVQTLLTDNLR